ncbi:chorion class B protein PC401-like isoform X2 [Maniola jurtina]|uniref:chorion class B protein PC401-like isoform X2 n=1 Tax=Maniola jurtina TaxID=191418 RepID=UPI001E68AA31|nr:chorion class B protein PC401-like isoform X2 [Maniola jurtina]
MFKLALLVCALALIQSISAQCCGPYNGFDIGCGCGCGGIGPFAGPYDGIGPIGLCGGLGPAALAASNGGGLVTTSFSPIAPTGVSMTTETCYEGPLAVAGAMPFLGAVALEGALQTVGGGAVAYGCGNGEVAIISEDIAALGPYDGIAGPYGFAGLYGFDGLGYGFGGRYGFDGLGCGFNGLYGYDGLGCGFNGLYGFDGLGCGFNGLNGFNGLGYGYNGLGCGFNGLYGYDGLGCGFNGLNGFDGFGYGFAGRGCGCGCGCSGRLC